MKKSLLNILGVALAGVALNAAAAELGAESFAARSRIEVSGSGPFHQLTLPMAVYQRLQRSDLGDLRVFNAQGDVLPHALLRALPGTQTQNAQFNVPLFPINGASTNANVPLDMSVEVKKSADGTLVSVRQSAPGVQRDAPRGLLLDLSKAQGRVRSLQLTMAPTRVPFHFFTIETSDDLQQWRVLKRDAQLVQLEHQGQRIEKNTVEWERDAGKYLRILWADAQQAPVISAAAVGITQTAVDQAPMIWSAAIAATASQDHTYDYQLPGQMPLEQLRINLAQINTVAPVRIQYYVEGSKHRRERGSWHTLAQTVAYRLQSAQGEAQAPDIVLNARAEQQLRLVVDARSGGVGSAAPTLQIGFVPQVLVFLGRGSGPYTLAWGAANVDSSALSPATLMPGYDATQKLHAAVATLQPLSGDLAAMSPASARGHDKPASKMLLWIVLLFGVAVLGGMVWLLIRQMKQAQPPKN